MPFKHLLIVVSVVAGVAAPAAALPSLGDHAAAANTTLVHKVVVLGKDTRRALPKRLRRKMRGVGRLIDTVGKSACTAFCVSDDAIATNNHCLAWGARKKYERTRNMRRFVFRLGRKSSRLKWQNIKPIGNPYLSTLSAWPQKVRWQNLYNDWTAARLRKPVCKGKALKLAGDDTVRRFAWPGGRKVSMIGYHKGRSRRRLSYVECYMTEVRRNYGNGVAFHSCDSSPGSSGSPIILESDFGIEVVAINQGETKFKKRQTFQFGSRRWRNLRKVNTAVLTLQLDRKLAAFLQLQFVDRRMTTRDLQVLMQRKGLWSGKIDGKVRRHLNWAIERYQHDRRKVTHGLPGKRLLHSLRICTGRGDSDPHGPMSSQCRLRRLQGG